jgi:hypothetical protein
MRSADLLTGQAGNAAAEPPAGVRAGGLGLDVYLGHDRHADKQRRFVRVAFRQVDAHGHALHDLDEIARGIFRWRLMKGLKMVGS